MTFQISRVVFQSKLDLLIYVHHNGQWINADLEDKIPVKLGERVYIQMVHDVSIWIIISWMIFLSIDLKLHFSFLNFRTNSKFHLIIFQVTYAWENKMEYDNSQEDHGINCVNSNNHLYDDCVIEVISFTLCNILFLLS